MKLPKLISALSGLGFGALSLTYLWYSIQAAALDYLGRDSKLYGIEFSQDAERSVGEIFNDIETGNEAKRVTAWSQLSESTLQSGLTDDEETHAAALCASTLRRPRRMSEIRFRLYGSDLLSFWREGSSRKLCTELTKSRALPLPLEDEEIQPLVESSNPKDQIALISALVVTPERPIPCEVLERLASDSRENSVTRGAQELLADSPQCLSSVLRVIKRKPEDGQFGQLLGSGSLGVSGLVPDSVHGSLDIPDYADTILTRWRCTSPSACDKALDSIADEKNRLIQSCTLHRLLSPNRKTEILKEVEKRSINVYDVPITCLPFMAVGDTKVFEQQIEKLLIDKSYDRQEKAIELLIKNADRIDSSPTLQRLLGASIGQKAGVDAETERLLQLLTSTTVERIKETAQEKFYSTCQGQVCGLAPFAKNEAARWADDMWKFIGILREAVRRGNTKVERRAVDDFLQIALARRTSFVAKAFVNLALELKHVPRGSTSVLKMLDLDDVPNLEQLLNLPLSITEEILIRKHLGKRADAKFATEFRNELNSQYPTRRLMALYGLRCTPWEEFKPVLDRALNDKSAIVQDGAAYLGFRSAPDQAALRGLLLQKHFHSLSGQSLQTLARRYEYEPSNLVPLASTLVSREVILITDNDTWCK